ncbi:MAG: DUF721 domain-containing protein [Gammaproteobacteria bacterium]|nr:DUF721 domain-containing protein [Gammaproteobacteria bacterium]
MINKTFGMINVGFKTQIINTIMNSPRQLYKFLMPKKGNVAELITHARDVDKLNDQFQILLDPSLRNHVRLSNIRGETLILTVESPVWASKLRYMGPILLQKLQNNPHLFKNICNLEITIQPARKSIPKMPITPRHLSESAARCIQDMADSIDNADLQKALHKLASRVSDKNEV